jgi:hypothetical protein
MEGRGWGDVPFTFVGFGGHGWGCRLERDGKGRVEGEVKIGLAAGVRDQLFWSVEL